MPSPCIGHHCSERRYRANKIQNPSVTGQTGKCPKDQDIIAATVKRLADEAAEKEDCPEGCKCVEGTWPATWTVLETGVAFAGRFFDGDCTAKVSFTYDWEVQEKSGPCYRRAPTKGDDK